MSEIFATAKQWVYPKGDTFRGILELQLGAVVLELMVFGEQKKGNGSAGAVFCVSVTIFSESLSLVLCASIYLFAPL